MENLETARRAPGRAPLNRAQTTREPVPGYRDPAERAAQIRESLSYNAPAENKFDIPKEMIPPGWDYMWVRASTIGKTDGVYGGDNIKARLAAGWEVVPAARHKDLLPYGYDGEYIEKEGLILMERPLEITLESRNRGNAEAAAKIRDKELSLGLTPQGTMPRDAVGATAPKITTSVEPMAVPKD